MNEDRNIRRKAEGDFSQYFYGEKSDPAYRRKNGQHSRNVARSNKTSKRIIGKHCRQLFKRDTRKRVDECDA